VNKIFLLLGSNIEPRVKYLEDADKEINKVIGYVENRSEVYESEPFGFNADHTFLNRILILSSDLSAMEVLNNIHIIEQKFGRMRSAGGYSSRTIDIDIIYFNNEVIKEENLTIPHPRMQERKFTLVPLAEIAADTIHPVLNITSTELLANCPDSSKVDVFKTPDVI